MFKRSFCILLSVISFQPLVLAQTDLAQKPEIALVPISALHPTQAYIAHDQVNYTLQRYRIDQQKLFDDLCENRGQGDKASFSPQSSPRDSASFSCSAGDIVGTRPQDMKTAVRGPGGRLYLTDGHHTFSIFQDFDLLGPDLEVAVVVTDDRSQLSPTEFWQWLQDSNLTWLYNAEGLPIDSQRIPARFGREALANDPYRAAMYFLRDLIWQRPQPAMPFAEFYWAQHIRSQPHLRVPALDSPMAYLRWLERLSGHMLALPAATAIGPEGEGPDAMGRLATDKIKDIAELLCDDGEPGRLALALAARSVAGGCSELGVFSDRAIILDLVQPAGALTAVIEIPAGSVQKWQMDKEHPRLLEWEREKDPVSDSGATRLRSIQYLPYPVNYGALPGTLAPREEGGDGDPLDVLVLGAALPRGASVSVRVLANLVMVDNGEKDDKLLAVLTDDPVYADVHSLAELNQKFPGITSIIETWFGNYKGDSGRVTGLQWQEWQ
ncbi:MAG: ParB-like protein [Pseudohongiella sp.]|nr:ParB-like protein [Pseudohongiella sp.]